MNFMKLFSLSFGICSAFNHAFGAQSVSKLPRDTYPGNRGHLIYAAYVGLCGVLATTRVVRQL
jgi:hypothetical protein